MKKQVKVIGLLLFGTLVLSACRGPNEEDYKSDVPVTRPSLEERMTGQEISFKEKEVEIKEEVFSTPDEINLDVIFYPQAPERDWSLPWQEACEESSLLLAHAYAKGKDLSLEEFKSEILRMVAWQNENFESDQVGVEPYEHTSVDQTAQILEEFLEFDDYKIVDDPTVEDLKKELAQGNVIVAPFAGRQLGNPFYSGEGPVYHMMVIRGYDEANFITNDVGTSRGENFIYSHQTIINAIHDWNKDDINQGKKKVIVLKPQK